MAHFPVFVDLSSRKCMVFGGGKVALRKIQTLVRYDADLHVIAREVDPEIEKLLPGERIHLVELKEEEDFLIWLRQAFLVIAATNSREINHQISSWCKEHEIFVNVIDAQEECTFLFPSVVKRGDISIGINTAGQSPVISKWVRKEIEAAVPAYYEEIAAQLGQLRKRIKESIDSQERRQIIFREIAAMAFEKEAPLSEEEIQNILLAH